MSTWPFPSVEKTITVTVQAPALSLALTLLRLDGSEFTGPPSGASGSTLLVDAELPLLSVRGRDEADDLGDRNLRHRRPRCRGP